MRTEIYACDRCGEPAAERARVTWALAGLSVGAHAHDMEEIDLCQDCANELRAWIGHTKEGQPWPTTQTRSAG